ncbi:M23 family metallopeptidase [Selenihalanaerobacter shriftii]|uniref:Murein DD-endopeptidase MepM and murein hydrolase activator NlpD, contain LysM domain n=1 Tax=Selenihalanaerobacter shriftii TaxID=142842 RepID=A0A1T4KZH4_9FIRM|nr:M23 family metallopeptidase [Selenihalanaerobacter shriftii]SJZ47874.1 Murein DD-endopeptidase MepM and murein hydrolase activator NlpD, contain LysM domain [Selenihalanaerobacter shriftii]
MSKDDKKDDKKFPFSIKTDKEDIKLKLTKNVQDLADKFSWHKFLTRVLTNKKIVFLIIAIIVGGALLLPRVYNSTLKEDTSYEDKVVIYEDVPGHVNKGIEKNSEVTKPPIKVQTKSNNKAQENREIKDETTKENKEVAEPINARPEFSLPVKGSKIERQYGWSKDPVLEDWRFHQGIDIAAAQATQIKSVANGKVEKVREDDYLGLVLVIKHSNGYKTVYGHAQKSYLEEGQHVKTGQAIGEVGDSGLVMKPTLHFEIWKENKSIKPSEYLNL